MQHDNEHPSRPRPKLARGLTACWIAALARPEPLQATVSPANSRGRVDRFQQVTAASREDCLDRIWRGCAPRAQPAPGTSLGTRSGAHGPALFLLLRRRASEPCRSVACHPWSYGLARARCSPRCPRLGAGRSLAPSEGLQQDRVTGARAQAAAGSPSHRLLIAEHCLPWR